MKAETSLTSRINLMISLDISIQIEKESEKRGINRTQFIKEAIHEKLKNAEKRDISAEFSLVKDELREIKQLTLATLERLQRTNLKET